MGDRLKVFILIAVLGFFAGIVADVFLVDLLPRIAENLPNLLNMRFVVSGILGAILTVLLVSIWAYLTREK